MKVLEEFLPTIYSGSEFRLDDIRLSLSENQFGCSPKVVQAIINEMQRIHVYPDAEYSKLRSAIANLNGVTSDNVYIGNGEDEIILSLALLINKDRPDIISIEKSFSGYRYATQIVGKNYIENKYDADIVYSICRKINQNTALVFICNPHNPLGTMMELGEILQIAQVCFKYGTFLVLDEAYIEYSSWGDTIRERKLYPNIILLRTFSKAYGLAGLRCGYLIAERHLCKLISSIRNVLPYNVNRLAQTAALTALKDQDYMKKVVQQTKDNREWFMTELKKIGIDFYISETNFVTINVKRAKDIVDATYQKHCILLRELSGMGYDNHIRISIGTKAQMMMIVNALSNMI